MMTTQIEPRLGCGAAIVVEGRILLVQRATSPEADCWGLPGGKIDLYETAPGAVAREIKEEINLAIIAQDLLCFVDQIDQAQGTHWGAPVYLVTAFDGTPKNREPAKHKGLSWFALDALPEALTTPTRFALAAINRRR